MHRRVILALVFTGSVLVWAADKDFWDTKPYSEWNDREVEKLLMNSPWSKSVSLSMGMMGGPGYGNERPQSPRPTSGGGAQPGAGGQTAGGQTAGGLETDPSGVDRRSAGGLGDPSERALTLVISWYSRPVREAFARRIQLKKSEAPQEQLDSLLKYDDPTHFAILIVGIPQRMPGTMPADLAQRLKEETFLQKKTKEKIPVADIVAPATPGGPLVLRFLKEADGKPVLTLEDKEVEFYSRMAGESLRAKFKLADMVVNGKLEL